MHWLLVESDATVTFSLKESAVKAKFVRIMVLLQSFHFVALIPADDDVFLV